jgi:dihydroorotate dehydrogenase (NAD+) catalytic subunit
VTDLTVNLAGLKLRNPVCVASGTAGNGPELAELMNLEKLGAFFSKAVTLEPRPGNPQPRIRELATGMLNSIGLANPGLDRFRREIIPFWRGIDTPLVVNVAGSTLEDYRRVCAVLDGDPEVRALELNVSCPNVREGGIAFGTDPRVLRELVGKCRRETEKPLIVKLSPQVTSVAEMAAIAVGEGADALTLINTIPGLGIDIRTRKPFLNTVVGGYSGPGIKPVALAQVYQVHRRVPVPIIGVGGIRSASDVTEFLLAGATAVQVGTGNFLQPDLSARLPEELAVLGEELGVERIVDLVGKMERP